MKYSEFFKMLEKKDHIINKLSTLTDEQKQEAIDFFTKHPSYENEIDWNRKDITWEDIEEVIYKERLSGTQLKNFVKKGRHFLVLYSDENCVLFQPLTWLGSRYLASTYVKPKIEGEWCISYQKNRGYWDDYSLKNEKSFIILCTSTTKYALEIKPDGDFTPWSADDRNLILLDFYDKISKEVPNIKPLLQKYIPIAISNHSLVEQLYIKDLEECAYIEKVKKEEREHRIKIFPKSFKRQIRRKGCYQWDGDISYEDLKDLGLVDDKGKVDERFERFKISGDLNFKRSPVTSIIIPSSITKIETNAFLCCKSLTEITIPNSVTSIGRYAFGECSSLTSINILNGVTKIGYSAFDGCSSLTSVDIPNSVTFIDDFAFANCISLNKITIPNSVTSIEPSTFYRCYSLKSIYINSEAFSIPGMPWSAENATVYWNNKPTTSHPYLVIESDGTVKCKDKEITEARIPEYINGIEVTSIKYHAFARCALLNRVSIPSSITSVGDHAFWLCVSLKSIYIDKEKDSLDLSRAKIRKSVKIYWRGEF